MRVKALLDQGSQRSYLSQRIKSISDLAPNIYGKHFYFDIRKSGFNKQSPLEEVWFNLKNE